MGEAAAATYACSGLTAYSALRKARDAGAAAGELLIVGLGGVGMAEWTGVSLRHVLAEAGVGGGREESGFGTACRQPDGTWKVM